MSRIIQMVKKLRKYFFEEKIARIVNMLDAHFRTTITHFFSLSEDVSFVIRFFTKNILQTTTQDKPRYLNYIFIS